MSHQDGWAAINLEMPKRVPRTEYSAESHWDLVQTITGISVSSSSPDKLKRAASQEFIRIWNYDLIWSVIPFEDTFGTVRTDMGHAEYAADGTDYNNKVTCPFKTVEDVLRFDPFEAYGKIDTLRMKEHFERCYKANCDANSDAVNMTGIYITCISGLIEILGWEMLLLSLGDDPKSFGDLTNRYARWIEQYFHALCMANVPIVMVHDDIVWSSGPFVSPEWYRRYVFPHYKRWFNQLHQTGKKILFTSDGDYTVFIDDVAKAGTDGFVLEPATDMQYIAEKYGRTHVFIGNVDTRVLLDGTKPEIRAEVERCMSIGKSCPGFFLAVGNHIPSNIPVENALYYNNVYEELSTR
jgi:hypothetical protein